MRRPAISRVGALVVVLAVVLCALMSGEAAAGEFRVASCQADRLNFSTQAFTEFATRGMKIKRACNPEGPGLREDEYSYVLAGRMGALLGDDVVCERFGVTFG